MKHASKPWRIELLGGLRVGRTGEEPLACAPQQPSVLLAYLALHYQKSYSREELIERLWPQEEDGEAAQKKMRNSLHLLRQRLKQPPFAQAELLHITRHTVGLEAELVSTDVQDFKDALALAAASVDLMERQRYLAEAVALYHGDLLPGFYQDCFLSERNHLSDLYASALHLLTQVYEQAGDLEQAVESARRAVAQDPLMEEAHCTLMRLFAEMGQPSAVFKQYQELERVLKEAFGEEPSPATRQLMETLRERAQTNVPRTVNGKPDQIASSIAETSGAGRLAPLPSFSEAHPAPAPTSLPDRSASVPAPSSRAKASSVAVGGTVLTFLLTDIVGSTALWERTGDSFQTALQAHHALLRQTFQAHHGQEIKETSDAFLVAFTSPTDALACALAGQKALLAHPWPSEIGTLNVRMALYSGEVQQENGQVTGLALHRASRMLTAAHGGQILCSQTTAELLRRDLDAKVRLLDLGVYRLRDVAEPERLFQVEHPDLAQKAFPPLNAEAGYRSHLPLQLTRFFGREEEIARLQEILLQEKARLVTITGPGGTGKTRLAIEAAGRLSAAFNGAVWFVPLADLSDPGLIAGAVLDAIRLTRSPQREPLEQIVEALSRQASLLILDNMEHLLAEPASPPQKDQALIDNRQSSILHSWSGASLVLALLSRVPTLILLVTSRQRLNLPGEREFPAPSLPAPNGPDTPEQLSLYDSVRLFVDRAQAVLPYFQVTNANAPAVAELCQRLEGLPLAIELAAARVQVLTPQQMLAQLENRFEFLTSRQRGVEERHRTLRAAVEWSYRLLTPELQRFFMRLSVFRGGWSVEAAEAVCEAPLALDYLAELQDSSLVLSEENEQGMRFRMLETLREFADERLSTEERAALRRRFAEYFSHISCDWQDWLNLLSAMDIAHEQGYTMPALRLVRTISWWSNDLISEGRRIIADILLWEEAAEPTRERADALRAVGWLATLQDDPVSVHTYLEEALAINRALGNMLEIAYTLDGLAGAAEMMGNYDTARSLTQEAIDILRRLEEEKRIPHMQLNLARLAFYEGDFVTARTLFKEIATKMQGQSGYCQLRLAHVARWEGDWKLAQDLAEDYVLNKAWCRMRKAEGMITLGEVAFHRGNTKEAFAHYAKSLSILQEIGRAHWVSYLLRCFAALAVVQGQQKKATRLYGADESLRQKQRLHLPPIERPEMEDQLVKLKEILSGEGFSAEWEVGRAMSWEQAVAYALEETN